MKHLFIAILLISRIGSIQADGLSNTVQPIWLDVRSATEFESGHLPGARNVAFDKIGSLISEITTDKNTAITLYCKSGRRAGFAKQSLERLGYSNVVNAGGIKQVLLRANVPPEMGNN